MSAVRKPVPRLTRLTVYDRHDKVCWYCGCELDWHGFHVEHKRALADGGGDGLDNLVPACGDCNTDKGVLSVEGYRAKVTADLVERLGEFGRSLARYENQYAECLLLNDSLIALVRRLAVAPVVFAGEQAAADYSI